MFEPSPGDALFSLYPIAAGRPYLRRNVRRVVRHLTMGSVFSSQKPSHGEEPRHRRVASDDEGGRPAKRQKMHHMSGCSHNGIVSEIRQPLSQVMGGNARPIRILEEIPPASFNGRLMADSHTVIPATPAKVSKEVKRSTSSSIKAILPDEPHFFHESLRVDNIEISSAMDDEDVDLNSLEGQDLPFDIKCRCSAAIFYAKNDQKPGDVDWNDFMEVSRYNQFCVLRIDYRHDGSISRKLILPEPFIFKPENFFVNRKKRKENGRFLSGKDCINTFGFADKYNLQVFIDPLNFNERWPPIAIDTTENASLGVERTHPISIALEAGSFDKDDLHLFSSIRIFSDPPMLSTRKTVLQVCHINTRQKAQYTLKLRLDWTLPNPYTKVNLKLPKGESRLKTTSKSMIHNPLRSPVRMQERASVSENPGDERIQRKRSNVATYNLKALSAQAQGRSPRKSNLPRSRSEQRILDRGEASIKYTFHKRESGEADNKFETTVVGLDCLFCGSRNISLDDLRLHLRTDHSAFRFVMRKNKSSVTFDMDVFKHRGGPNLEVANQRTFEMRKPKSILNLEVFLGGDETWAALRHRLQNNRWPEYPSNGGSSMSSSANGSRQSSPNTSADYDFLEKPNLKPPPGPKVFLVPHTPRPTYDSNTKQVLQPGDRLSESDGDHDETWLHHMKHDLLNEFEDVAEEEKEYLRFWNLSLVDEHLTSDKYLALAVIRFAETNKVWIMETKSHMVAFMRHMEALKLRGVFDRESLDKCIWILKSVKRASIKGKEREVDILLEQQVADGELRKQRKPGDCICGERPLPYDKISCRGVKCKARIFHQACAENMGRSIRDKWECDDCFT